MPTAPKKYCCRCYQFALPGSSYCEAHQSAKAEADKQRKAGDKWRPFYNKKVWRTHVRNSIVAAYNGQCARLVDGVRCPLPGVHIHHKIEPRVWCDEMGNDFYDESNLTLLCAEHHSAITAARRVGREDGAEYAPPDNDFSPVI